MSDDDPMADQSNSRDDGDVTAEDPAQTLLNQEQLDYARSIRQAFAQSPERYADVYRVLETVAGYAWETVSTPDGDEVTVPCPWCRRQRGQVGHTSECLVTRARALLVQLPAPPAPTR
jgi:hypothetical protein